MAVNIDRVYQKVLAIANKEQRGYITPQEFNLMADKAQMEIFNNYFHDYKTGFYKAKSKTETVIDRDGNKVPIRRVPTKDEYWKIQQDQMGEGC